ncbi:hypothetical protein Tco_1498662, partial [Tanacetum coccineum]
MRTNVKTYDGSEYPEDHLRIFHIAAEVKRWGMPTWFQMFNSTLMGAARLWFGELLPKSVDIFEDLRRKMFLSAYLLQQNKYTKDHVELHHVKQREGEYTEALIECFKVE